MESARMTRHKTIIAMKAVFSTLFLNKSLFFRKLKVILRIGFITNTRVEMVAITIAIKQQQMMAQTTLISNNNKDINVWSDQQLNIMEKVKKNKKKKYTEIDLNVNPMRRAEKLFKYSSIRETDWSLLFDIEKEDVEKVMIQNKRVIKFKFPDSAFLVKEFLSSQQQLQISQQCINEFVRKPYRTNLSGDKGLYKEQSHSDIESEDEDEQNQKKEEEKQFEKIYIQSESQKMNPICDQQQQKNQPNQKQQTQLPYDFNQKIRWSNLGYNYDWTNRSYPKTKTLMPASIAEIASKANSLFNQLTHKNIKYTPQAVIVNYYKQRDAMTAHLDDAQQDQQSPIYSFAFGLSCVFLIGQDHKDADPLAVKIQSGDLFIMSGSSRRSYHGVPRVIASTFNKQQPMEVQKQAKSGPNSISQTLNYLRSHRININIRQVYNKSDSI